ncbi:MAG: ABC transporter substrate-binding protein [Gammaproteobacteria bacterium]|nr:ABC transporter substrate-binding protein [Gammaproteobacteria bacterium]
MLRLIAAAAFFTTLVIFPALASAVELRVSAGSDLRSSEPGVNRDDTADAIMSHVVETLVTLRDDLSVAPMLAENWAVTDDGRSYVFSLRKNVRFHDGTEFDAEVVAWNWSRFLATESRWYCRQAFVGDAGSGGLVRLLDVSAVDRYSVRFRLAEPSALFLPLLASIQCMAGAYGRSSVDSAGRWRQPVGTGPFKFGQWRRGRDLVLDRYTAYRPSTIPVDGLAGRRDALVDRVRFTVIPDPNSALAAFNAGDIDVLSYQPVSILSGVANRSGITVHQQPLLGWTVLLMQTRDPLISDPRIRAAIAHAIDRTRLARTATESVSRSNASAVPLGSVLRSAEHDVFPAYNPERARQLLRAANYSGQPIEIQTNRLFRNMFDNAVMVHAMLRSVGMNPRISVLDWATQLSNYQQGHFQLSSFGYSGRVDPALSYDLLLGDKGVRPTVQWQSKTAESVLAAAAKEQDANRRIMQFAELHRLMAADLPIIGLYNGTSISVAAPGVAGLRTWRGATPIFWGITKR